MTKRKLPKAYNIEKLPWMQEAWPLRKLPGGVVVMDEGGTTEAFDAKNRWLGLFPNTKTAEKAVARGWVSQLEVVPQLDLWDAWNGLIDCGRIPYQDMTGRQILSLTDTCFFRATSGKDQSVEVLTDVELGLFYWDDEVKAFRLIRAEKPFKVE